MMHFHTKQATKLKMKIRRSHEDKMRAPLYLSLIIKFGVVLIVFIGYLREFLRQIGLDRDKFFREPNRKGYPPVLESFASFYNQNFFVRLRHGWSQPVSSVPGEKIDLMERVSYDRNKTFSFTGRTIKAINMGSYNYLGMAENSGPRIDHVREDIQQYGSGTTSCRSEFGTTATLLELEQKVAAYLGVEAAFVVGMGFATNSNNIPALFAGKGTLVISDELNHASLIVGCKLAGATCRVFKHNDTVDLERILRRELLRGQPTGEGAPHRPWKKVIILVEGIFSMEGTIVDLPEILRIKKKYKAYVYLDEAHSVGALDKGIVNYYNCDPKDVDILMGTFTKSFGAAGGYIAGTKELVDYLRARSHSTFYAGTMAAPVARQIIGVIDSIVGHEDPNQNEGYLRIKKLKENTNYFRTKLKKLGFIVIGDHDSPVIPLIVYSATIVIEIINEARKRGVAIVGAGYPATPLLQARIRFCVSSAHTKEMLDYVLEVMDELGDRLHFKFAQELGPICSQSIFDLNCQ